MIIIFVIGILVSFDLLLISKAGIGPFFAIRTKVYKDGGSKEYYGLGYKVIKYHQKEGRRDLVLGGWSLSYNVRPLVTSLDDLALEFRNDPKATYKNLYQSYMKITGTIYRIDTKGRVLTLRYKDENGDLYTIDADCKLLDTKTNLDKLNKDDTITIVGSLYEYTAMTKQAPRKIYLKNCFLP